MINATDFQRGVNHWKWGNWQEVYGAEASGKDYRTIDFKGKVCIIIGSEGHGIKQIVINNCDEIVSLPMKGKINSLNASVAAGILIYEIMKYKQVRNEIKRIK